jgi:hypothetical protein
MKNENTPVVEETKTAEAAAPEIAEAKKGKKAAKEAADDAEIAEANEGLVKMHKDGQISHVHPTTVQAHIHAGWKHA